MRRSSKTGSRATVLIGVAVLAIAAVAVYLVTQLQTSNGEALSRTAGTESGARPESAIESANARGAGSRADLDEGGNTTAAGSDSGDAALEVVEHRVLEGVTIRMGASGEWQPFPNCPLKVGPRYPPTLAVSDASAHFRIELDGGDFRAASAMLSSAVEGDPDLLNWSRRIDFAQGQRVMGDLRVAVQPYPDARGVAVDRNGEPVPGVKFKFIDKSTATSDAQGEFGFGRLEPKWYEKFYEWSNYLQSDQPDYDVVDVMPPYFDDSDALVPMRVTVCEAVPFVIVVEDAAGAPVEHAEFQLGFDLGDFERAREGKFTYFTHPIPFAKSDADGRATFPSVPRHVHLNVQHGGTTYSRVTSDGQLVADSAADRGALLTVGSHEVLRLRLGKHVRFFGTVFDPDGTEASFVGVTLLYSSEDTVEPVPASQDAFASRSDYSIEAALPPGATHAIVRAEGMGGPDHSRGSFLGMPDPRQLGMETRQLVGDGRSEFEANIHLMALGKITGRVVVPKEHAGASVMVTLLPNGEPGLRQFWTGGRNESFASSGYFQFTGVPDGRYRIHARADGVGTTTSDWVGPNDRDVVLTLDSASLCSVRILVDAEYELEALAIASGAIEVKGEAPFTMPRSWTTDFGASYPPIRRGLRPGSEYSSDSRIAGHFDVVNVTKDEAPTLHLAAGAAWIGALATGVGGMPMHPVGTGPVTLPSGESVLTLRLVPAASLRATLTGNGGLEAEVRTPAGKLVDLTGPNELRKTRVRISALGHLAIGSIPAVPLELWVGSREELERGEPRTRVSLKPNGGECVEIER